MVETKQDQQETHGWSHYKVGILAWLGSFCVSILGALMLTFWEMKYHPTYSQLWMVPFGLVLSATPPLVWFSIFVSDVLLLCSETQHDEEAATSHAPPVAVLAAPKHHLSIIPPHF